MYMPGYRPVPPMVSIFNRQVGWMTESLSINAPGSGAYEGAAVAVYFPILIASGCVVRRVWWANGATITNGSTIGVGVYSDSGYGPGVKLVSGSAVQSGATSVQFVDVTDTTLGPGRYWLAIVASSATNTDIFRSALDTYATDASIRFQESSAYPLPATATPVESTVLNAYLFGFATTASP